MALARDSIKTAVTLLLIIKQSISEETCACASETCAVCEGDGVCCTPGSMESLCCHEERPKCCQPLVVGTACCEEDDICCPSLAMGNLGCCEKTEPICMPGQCCSQPCLEES